MELVAPTVVEEVDSVNHTLGEGGSGQVLIAYPI